jgi:23S rRNA (cytidine2498-2'-O)-methyltransferase
MVVELTHDSHVELLETPLFFAAQTLPDAKEIQAASISIWASAILDYLVARFGETAPSWSLSIFEPDSCATGTKFARQARIEDALLENLRKKRRAYLRALKDNPSSSDTIVQVLAVTPERGYISIVSPDTRQIYGSSMPNSYAGFTYVADDKRPPSRAFKKLREAIQLFSLPVKKGQTAVDLGASPGGWTYVMRQLGLTVTAIDRSPLDSSLSRDRGIVCLTGDALSWKPTQCVDWMICDVITAPINTAKLLKEWLGAGLCRNFCVTVKFKGEPDFDTLVELSAFLKSSCSWFDARQLTSNKNELTLVGKEKEPKQTI